MADERPTAGSVMGRLHVAYKAVLLAAALWVAWFYFRQIVTLLLALVLMTILAITLTAVTDRLQRRGVPRVVGAVVSLLAGLATVAGVVWLVVPPFVDELRNLAGDLPDLLTQLPVGPETAERAQARIEAFLTDPGGLLGSALRLGATIFGVVVVIVVVVLTALFIAINPWPIVEGTLRLFPPADRRRARAVLQEIRAAWVGWVKGVAFDMLVAGVLTWLALGPIIGLEFAVLFAVITGLLEFVPYFGPIIASIPPILFALSQSLELAIVVAIAFVVVQQIQSNVVVPLVMSEAVKLHPALIAAGVAVFGGLFGIMGLFVAVPLLSLTTILVRELWILPRERTAADGHYAGAVRAEDHEAVTSG